MTNSYTPTQYLSVDLFKFIMALLVVGIHCQGIGYGAYPQWLTFINRQAVPFFFVTTGFLLQRKISQMGGGKIVVNEVFTRSLRKSLRLYVIWTAVYLPLTLIGYSRVERPFYYYVALFMRQFLFVGDNHYSWPLWYLLALVVALFLLRWLLCRGMSVRDVFLLGVGLMLLAYGYECVADVARSGPVYELCRLYKFVFSSTRNGFFQGFPLIATGMFLAHVRWTERPRYLENSLLLAVGAALFALDVVPVFLCVSIFGLFSLIVRLKVSLNPATGLYLRHMSMWIYFLHMYFVYAMVVLHRAGLLHLSIYANWLVVAAAVLLVSTACYALARTHRGAWLQRLV